jgi:hypothetical protein
MFMFFKGVTFPAVQALISKWLPGPERSRLGAFIWGGKESFNHNNNAYFKSSGYKHVLLKLN